MVAAQQHVTAAQMIQRDEVAQLRFALVARQAVFIRSRSRRNAQLASLRSRRKTLEKRLASFQVRAAAAYGLGGGPVVPFSAGGGAYGFFPAPGTNYSFGVEPILAARLDRLGKALHLHLIGLSGYRTPAHSDRSRRLPQRSPHPRAGVGHARGRGRAGGDAAPVRAHAAVRRGRRGRPHPAGLSRQCPLDASARGYASSMDLALFALRIVAGLLMAGHGAQKLFGSFGGHGIAGTGQFFESLGLRPGQRHARLAGLSEFGGGLLLVLGLLTPLGAAAVIGVMTVAILTVHLPKGCLGRPRAATSTTSC